MEVLALPLMNTDDAQLPEIPDMEPFGKRLKALDEQMAQPDFFQDQRKAATLSREQQKLQALVEQYEELQQCLADEAEHTSLLEDPDQDEDLKALAQEELEALSTRIPQIKREILQKMIPAEESDARNTVIEIRAGAGGDEASLFVGDLFRMYQRYAEVRGWRIEVMGTHPSDCGGFKEVAFLVTGEDVYKRLKYESGVHRVQRIPQTESSGRIHTSTVTVAVLPEAQEVDVQVDPSDLEITVSRASGPGGQGVNTTDSAVQILHKPTGLIVNCADERSQIKNKAKALKVLYSRLLKRKEEEEREKHASERRNQIGSGDRSERIRTYNFPQSRVTDHRISLTLQGLEGVLDGNLDAILDGLHQADTLSRIQALIAS